MSVKKVLTWLARHRGALAKIALSVFALLIILMLPLRTAGTVVENGTTTYIEKVVSIGWLGKAYAWNGDLYDITDYATVNGDTIAVAYSGRFSSIQLPTNLTCSDFVKYGMKMHVEASIESFSISNDLDPAEAISLNILCGDRLVTYKSYPDLSVDVSYLDLVEKFSTSNDTLVVEVYFTDAYSASVSASITGSNTVRIPLYTAITQPVASAVATLWGAILGFIRRVRSVLNSALAGFWGFFGISAVTGNILLSIVIVALLLYIAHYRHIFKRKR